MNDYGLLSYSPNYQGYRYTQDNINEDINLVMDAMADCENTHWTTIRCIAGKVREAQARKKEILEAREETAKTVQEFMERIPDAAKPLPLVQGQLTLVEPIKAEPKEIKIKLGSATKPASRKSYSKKPRIFIITAAADGYVRPIMRLNASGVKLAGKSYGDQEKVYLKVFIGLGKLLLTPSEEPTRLAAKCYSYRGRVYLNLANVYFLEMLREEYGIANIKAPVSWNGTAWVVDLKKAERAISSRGKAE